MSSRWELFFSFIIMLGLEQVKQLIKGIYHPKQLSILNTKTFMKAAPPLLSLSQQLLWPMPNGMRIIGRII